MNPSTVLLARPHPAIVDSMSTFLSEAGYQPKALSSLKELRAWPGQELAAIVVSTSVASTAQGSFEDTVRAAIRAHPGVALVFATVVDAGHARTLLSETLAAYGLPVCIQTVDDMPEAGAHRGQGSRVLLLNRRDLEGEAARRRAAAALEVLVRGSV